MLGQGLQMRTEEFAGHGVGRRHCQAVGQCATDLFNKFAPRASRDREVDEDGSVGLAGFLGNGRRGCAGESGYGDDSQTSLH